MWPFTAAKPPSVEAASQPKATREADSILRDQTSAASEEPDIQKFPGITGYANERLSIPLLLRAPLLLATSFTAGFSLGAVHGGSIAAYRYRAENAHRLPTTQTGWYLYQKSKNYHSIIGGVTEGVKLGGILCAWATIFMCCEEAVDNLRGRLFAKGDDDFAYGQRDSASTVVAAMSTAGIYSWKQGLDKFTAARAAKTALKYSFLYGIVQDMAASLRGNRPAYVDWALRKAFGVRSTAEP